MDAEAAEAICSRLSPLLKNTIRSKLLKAELPCQYTDGEALLFWFADWMSGLKLVQPDQLRLVLETLAQQIISFGNAVGAAMVALDGPRSIKGMRDLPVCKVGFLDREYVCMDGWDKFLELRTGETPPATNNMPVETIAYNLTSIFVRYTYQMKRK
jgi:hypothetical protein